MLQIKLESVQGWDDVYVYTNKSKDENPGMGWVDPSPSLAGRQFRNVAAFPICIHNPDTFDYIGPSVTDASRFTTIGTINTVLKDSVRISILREDDSVVKSMLLSPLIQFDIESGKVVIKAGKKYHTIAHQCWFDKTGSIPVDRLYYGLFEFEPIGWMQSVYCNLFGLPMRFYTGAVTHGLRVDIYHQPGT